MKPPKSARWTLGLKKLKAISIRQPWAWLMFVMVTVRQDFQRFSVPNFRFSPH